MCAETGDSLEEGTKFWAATRGDVDLFWALSADVLECIPDSEKRPAPCPPGDDGIDIHHASCNVSYAEWCTLPGFAREEFSFSLSRAAAAEYLPRLVEALDQQSKLAESG
jgi:hypothetical protein